MAILMPFFILSAVADAVICLNLDCSGLALAGAAVLFYIVCLLGSFALYVLFFGVCSLFVDMRKLPEKASPFWSFAVKCTVGIISALFGARIHLEGEELIPKGRWLFVCNHLSGFDPIITAWALRKHDLAFIAKPSIMRIPIAGRAIHKACFMPIDRENDREALKTIIRAATYLKNDVTNIGIYPEGTRSKDGKMGEFKNGAFKIAQKARTAIVVAKIKYERKLSVNFLRGRNDVYLKICKVISAEEAANMKTNEISEEAQKCIMLASV